MELEKSTLKITLTLKYGITNRNYFFNKRIVGVFNDSFFGLKQVILLHPYILYFSECHFIVLK